MTQKIRKATKEDLDAIMIIIDQGKAYLKAQGLDQWQNGQPSPALLLKDIQKESCYVYEEDGCLYGVLSVLFEVEEAFTKIIQGQWLSQEKGLGDVPYAVIHRMAIHEAKRGSGLANQLFLFAEELCREKGVISLRIDTHEQNKPMQGAIKRNGFTYCGVVYYGLEESTKRLGFEKLL